jgi:hypothetical protein
MKNKMTAWRIYSSNGDYIDTVFYHNSMSGVEVKNSLCSQDKYSLDCFLIREDMV